MAGGVLAPLKPPTKTLLEAAMRKTSILAAVALSAFAGTMVACDDDNDLTDIIITEDFAATLNAASEIPAPIGAPTATGVAGLTLENGILTVVVDVNGPLTSGVTGAHIHGPATTTQVAPIVLDFTPSMAAAIAAGATGGQLVNVVIDLNVEPVDPAGVLRVSPAVLVDMLRTGSSYLNVHTVLNPDGEIRGQILP